jgi:DNA-directed RNA polymerase I subunit RPA43
MLSLRGSIQPDPFSPAHVPQTSMKAMSEPASESSTAVVRDAILPLEEEEEEGTNESGVDTFERLGRMGDEAAAKAAKRRAEEAKEAEAENEEEKERKKKRKRKDGNIDGEGKVKSKSKSKDKRSRT